MRPLPFSDHGRERAHDLAIEARDALRRAGADVELDIGHAQHDAAEAALVRRMNVDAVAPRADGLDAIVAFAEVELRSLSGLRICARRSSSAARSGTTSPVTPRRTSGSPVGRWNWLIPTLTHMLPRAGIEEGIAREPEAADVVMRRQVLVGDAHIDMPEIDDVAEILGCAVVLLVCHGAFLPNRGY